MPVVVRYQAKPDRADENQALIEAVFADLEASGTTGFSYQVFRLDDGVSFIHIVVEDESATDPDSLADVPAFQAFTKDIAERCDVQPNPMRASEVGHHLGA